ERQNAVFNCAFELIQLMKTVSPSGFTRVDASWELPWQYCFPFRVWRLLCGFYRRGMSASHSSCRLTGYRWNAPRCSGPSFRDFSRLPRRSRDQQQGGRGVGPELLCSWVRIYEDPHSLRLGRSGPAQLKTEPEPAPPKKKPPAGQ